MRADDSAIASTDKICCMCCSDKFLMVGREFGVLHCYDIVGLRQEGKETLHCRPHGILLLYVRICRCFAPYGCLEDNY